MKHKTSKYPHKTIKRKPKGILGFLGGVYQVVIGSNQVKKK